MVSIKRTIYNNNIIRMSKTTQNVRRYKQDPMRKCGSEKESKLTYSQLPNKLAMPIKKYTHIYTLECIIVSIKRTISSI